MLPFTVMDYVGDFGFLFFFLEIVYFPSGLFPCCWPLWKSSLRPPGGGSCPFSGRLNAPISRDPLHRPRTHLPASRPVCDFSLSDRELRVGAVHHPEILPWSQASRSNLIFLFNRVRTSVEGESRHSLLWVFTGNGAAHAQNFLGQHPTQQTHWVGSLAVATDGDVQRAQRRVCATQSDGRQDDMRHPMRDWWSALQSATTRNLGSWKAVWIWLVEVSGVKWQQYEWLQWQNTSAQLTGQGSWMIRHWHWPGFHQQQWHELPTEGSPKFSSDAWGRRHQCSFCRCTAVRFAS